MIRVDFRKPTPAEAFDDWVKRCAAALRKLKTASGVKEKLYKEQRQAILDLFHGKCGYCEAKITLDQHAGDVEHFRPKGGVTDENDRPIKVTFGKRKRAHPGYFWLAYDPLNLLPACIACNRPGKVGDRRVGKWKRFPIAGKYATSPDGLAEEKPLLLNPLIPEDDPAFHLQFDPDTGRIIAKSDRGKMTVDILDLNREGLPEARREVYENVLMRASRSVGESDQSKRMKDIAAIQEHKTGNARYSMAGRVAIAHHLAIIEEQTKLLRG